MNKEFYAALIEDSYRVEGDERSRTHPGHGYPAHTVNYTRVQSFKDKEEVQKWVENEAGRIYNKTQYKIVKCVPMEVKTTVKVVVECSES